MTAREIYNAIQRGDKESQQQALYELLALNQELATATLELAHHVKQLIGYDPVEQRPRLWLSEFLDLPKGER